LIAAGKEDNTVRLRQAALRAFVRWLLEEDELRDDPLIGLKTPKIPTKIVQGLTDDQLRDLIKACQGGSFTDQDVAHSGTSLTSRVHQCPGPPWRRCSSRCCPSTGRRCIRSSDGGQLIAWLRSDSKLVANRALFITTTTVRTHFQRIGEKPGGWPRPRGRPAKVAPAST
jgi:integrase